MLRGALQIIRGGSKDSTEGFRGGDKLFHKEFSNLNKTYQKVFN